MLYTPIARSFQIITSSIKPFQEMFAECKNLHTKSVCITVLEFSIAKM